MAPDQQVESGLQRGGSAHNGWQPSLVRRLVSLLIGIAYLAMLSWGVSVLEDMSLIKSTAIVVVCAAVIIFVIAVFAVKLFNRKEKSLQLKLATLFLPFVPIAIYLSLFSRFLVMIRKFDAQHVSSTNIWLMLPFFALFMILTTAVLLAFGEACIWFGIRLLLALKRYRGR